MTKIFQYSLFEAFGIEIEYMIVDSKTLLPRSIAHELLIDESGEVSNSIEMGDVVVSNELAAHVIEIKTPEPTDDLAKSATAFQTAINSLNRKLKSFGAMLAPSGMHPFMRPKAHGRLWQYGDREIYEWYDRTFGCDTHGWLNLQSCHLNLPFQNEEQFALLHDAIIIALPLLPAISAASPYVENRYDGHLDTRLLVYACNQKRFPTIAGSLIPERMCNEATYREKILVPVYESVRSLDPKRIIHADWLNSRGAIARFDRGSIELRILDTQENPRCDFAICTIVIRLLQRLVQLGSSNLKRLVEQFSTVQRKQHLMSAASNGRAALFHQRGLASILDLGNNRTPQTLGDFWATFCEKEAQLQGMPFEALLTQGNLAERIMRRCGAHPTSTQLEQLLGDLCQCLENGSLYTFETPSLISSTQRIQEHQSNTSLS